MGIHGGKTSDADALFKNKSFARGEGNLRLIDSDALIYLVLERYDRLAAKYKGILSLRCLYAPEHVQQEDQNSPMSATRFRVRFAASPVQGP